MEKRGSLMLAIQARICSTYFPPQQQQQQRQSLPIDSHANTHPPPRSHQNEHQTFLLLAENKIKDTGEENAYSSSPPSSPAALPLPLLHPVTPATAYIRPRPFTKEDCERYLTHSLNHSHSRASPAESLVDVDARRSLLYAHLALVDARASWAFFRDGEHGFWDERWVEGGASRAWFLVWAGAWVGSRAGA
ncbi:endo-1,3-beta glucanase [Coniothyrium glycines]